MNKCLWVLLLAFFVVILLACKTENSEPTPFESVAPVAQQIATNILTAQEKLAAGQVSEGAGLLLDAVLLAGPGASWPVGFEEKLETAREQFQASEFKDAVGSITEALELFKASAGAAEELGKPDAEETENAQPEETPAGVAGAVQKNLATAVEKFKAGDADGGIILILEALTVFAPKN
jgi:hypothetical protein